MQKFTSALALFAGVLAAHTNVFAIAAVVDGKWTVYQSMLLEGIDYDTLAAHSSEKASFEGSVRATIAKEAGVDPADVVVTTSKGPGGFVVATSQIKPPSGSTSTGVMRQLLASRTSIARQTAALLRNYPHLKNSGGQASVHVCGEANRQAMIEQACMVLHKAILRSASSPPSTGPGSDPGAGDAGGLESNPPSVRAAKNMGRISFKESMGLFSSFPTLSEIATQDAGKVLGLAVAVALVAMMVLMLLPRVSRQQRDREVERSVDVDPEICEALTQE